MSHVGKMIVLVGLGIVVVGGIVWGLGRLGFRGLPGDINYQSGNVRIYIPIVSCLAVSAILSVLFWLAKMLVR